MVDEESVVLGEEVGCGVVQRPQLEQLAAILRERADGATLRNSQNL